MKQAEITTLVIVGVAGAVPLFLSGNSLGGWLFIMGVAALGECTDVLARKMEKLLQTTEDRHTSRVLSDIYTSLSAIEDSVTRLEDR